MAVGGSAAGQFASFRLDSTGGRWVQFQTNQSLAFVFQLNEDDHLAVVDLDSAAGENAYASSSGGLVIYVTSAEVIAHPANKLSYLTCSETNDNKLACVTGDENILLHCPKIHTYTDIDIGTVGSSNAYVSKGLCELLTVNVLCIW